MRSLDIEAESSPNSYDLANSGPMEQRLLSCIMERNVMIPSEESFDPGRYSIIFLLFLFVIPMLTCALMILLMHFYLLGLTAFNFYNYISNFAG